MLDSHGRLEFVSIGLHGLLRKEQKSQLIVEREQINRASDKAIPQINLHSSQQIK